MQRLRRFAFDVELMYIALKHRLDIKRIPVRLRYNETSTVRLVRDASQAFVDVFRIKWHQVRGDYVSPALDEAVRLDYQRVFELASAEGSTARAKVVDERRARAGRP
jgi:hypothetical protein